MQFTRARVNLLASDTTRPGLWHTLSIPAGWLWRLLAKLNYYEVHFGLSYRMAVDVDLLDPARPKPYEALLVVSPSMRRRKPPM